MWWTLVETKEACKKTIMLFTAFQACSSWQKFLWLKTQSNKGKEND
tara:strand:- start:4640 stop:4777 length:138 start_codon:yes stop_codon:yes gene_type:complete